MAVVVATLSCGREPTSPGASAGVVRSQGIAFATEFPAAYPQFQAAGGSGVAFTKVRIVLNNADGTVALDTVVTFPDGAPDLQLTLSVPLPAGAPASGVPLSLSLKYVNAAGDTVFTGGPVTVIAVPKTAGGGPPPPSTVTIPITYTGPGANATAVRIAPATLTVNTSGGFTFTAQAVDASGTVVPNTPIVFSSQNPILASINAVTGTGIAGATRGTVGVVAQLLTGPTALATLTIVSPPSGLALVSGGGQTGPVNATLAAPVVVRVTATDGLPAPGVAVTFAAQNGGSVGSASGTTGADGTAQTTWTLGPTAGAQTLTASAAGLSGSPVTLTATARSADPVRVVIATQPPASTAAGSGFGLVVTVVDAANSITTAFTGPVTIALGSGAPAGAVLSGATTVNAVAGVATFTGVSLNLPGTYTLVASAGGLGSATSTTLQVLAGAANRMVFQNYPVAGSVAGTPFDAITVIVRDALGNVVPTFTGAVTLTIAPAVAAAAAPAVATAATVAARGDSASPRVPPAGAAANVLSGTTTVNAVAGVATFTGLTQTTAGTWLLTATATGLASATGPIFTVTPGVASTLVLVSGGGQSAAGSAALANPVVVSVTDGFGNGVSGVTVTFAPAVGSGIVSPTSAITDAAGHAQTAWTLGGTAGLMALNVSGTGLTPNPLVVVATATTSVIAGPATKVVFTTQPVATAAAASITPAVVVTAKDAGGLVATSFTGTVAVTIAVNPAAGTLGGTTSVAAVAGVATFPGLSINNPGVGYKLRAGSGALTPDTSVAFNIGTPAVASTLVSPPLDTLTAIGATFGLSAQARDALLNPIAGTFVWVSRSPAVATVNAGGTVTAVTNGTTWVVATEAGGTKDSAKIVVAQRLATISVTPNPRNIYLGTSYQFAASAVDGLGVPLTAQPGFTWSTLSGAIASVNGSGLATGTGLGSTQVRATSGAVTGTALLNVLTPVTRIVVSRDSAGFATTASDTFTLAALGRTRSYRATARDTLDNPLTGITFTWTSSNGAVAGLDSINTATVRATAAANGITSITAMAQGIAGSAALNVQQVLTSVDLSPTTATIAPTGSVALVARGRDANGFFIPGGSFTFASAQPAIATVGSASGVVTGVANGSASITAQSGAITSNAAIITVGGVVPAKMSFGRDTLTVGRSGSASVPVYLSKPFTGAVTVNLAVRDTFAFFSTASISIPAGQTAGNATLNGHNAGTTKVFATDGGGGGGYAGDSAVLAVQATVRFTMTSYSLNVTDQLSTQVLLSDPAPAGGTYVTFNYGTAGKVNVSPNPAFIPAGQLAANVVALATGANTSGTTATPAATGVNGTASTFYTYAAVLTGPSALRLGTGQYEPSGSYAQVSAYLYSPLGITLTSSDTSKVTVPGTLTLPASSYYQYYPVSGKAVGTATVTASATGWTPVTTSVTVTTPKLGVCCGGSYNTTSPQFGVTVYAEDSVSTPHYRSSSLVVSLSSTDPTVLSVLTPTITIPAGLYYSNSGLAIPAGVGGTAKIIASASGHKPDTATYTVAGPVISLGFSTGLVGVGQQESAVGFYVQVPNYRTTPLTVTLTNSDSTIAGLPTTVTIPTGAYYTYFTVRGKALGSVTVTVSAPGHTSGSAGTIRVTTPRLVLGAGGTLNNFGPTSGFTVYTTDSVGSAHVTSTPVIVSYTSSNPAVITVTGLDTVQAGVYYTNHAVVTPIGAGSAKIIATATAGYRADSAAYTVQTPTVSLSWATSRLGRGQYDQNFYVSTPNYRTSPLTVTITQKKPLVDSLSQTTIVIPNGGYYTYFNIAGLMTGADTLLATATGYNSSTAYMIVTTPKLLSGGLPSSVTTTNPPSTVTVYATDSVGTAHNLLKPLTVKATSSNSAVVQPTAPGFVIAAGSLYSQPQVAYTGPGSASVTYSDSLATGYLPTTTNTVTVTGPSLSISNYTPVLGMRQNGGPNSAYVSVPNSITGSPLVVNLVSSGPTVAQVPATVTIPVGTSYAYFQIAAQDVVGTIQIQATATGYGGATTNVQVTQPKFVMTTASSVNTTSPRQTITIYATDANGTWHYTNENVAVTLASSSTVVGTTDSATVTIVANAGYTQAARFIPGSAGTTQLSATDARVAAYKYSTGTFNVAVNTPTLTLSFSNSTLGIGQYDNQTVYTPDYQTSALTVNLAHFNGSTTTPSSVTIGSATFYASMKVIGAAAGIDTITYSAAGHSPVKGAITVAAGRLDPISSWPSSLTQGDSVLVTIYARDANASVHYAAAATTLTLTPTAKIQFVSGGLTSAPITSATIPADQQYVQVWLKALAAGTGTGSAQISSTNYTTYVTPTVNVP